MDKNFASFLKWRMTSEPEHWPEQSEIPAYDRPPERVYGNELRVSWVGHATVLIQTEGLNILTDPIWAERASPLTWLGPRRVHPPGIAFENLPPIDVVLVSHNHYDHLDLTTLARLRQAHRPRIIVPLGNDILLAEHDPPIVAEAYDWGAKVMISETVAVHLDPMHHWSARGIFDRNKALWAAFTVTTPGGNIYFVGDSGYGQGDFFRAAKDTYHQFRLAILPIGDSDPRWFMSYGHMSPEECVRAFDDLGRPTVLPVHHSTFPLADTGYSRPLTDLQRAVAGHEEAQQRIVPLPIGHSRMIPR
jgi:L-ascorbate metabolism protein UlaG (beta-lactamase superfamily)